MEVGTGQDSRLFKKKNKNGNTVQSGNYDIQSGGQDLKTISKREGEKVRLRN
jgi:hypothetical protein